MALSRLQDSGLPNYFMNYNFWGMYQYKSDYSLFVKHNGDRITVVVVYVDDIFVTGNGSSSINDLKNHLHNVCSIKDLGHLHYFLGMEVHYVNDGIVLS